MSDDATPNPDVYLDHLAALQTRLGVIAADDIVNEHGMLLARRGTALTERMVAQLRRHALAQSVDSVIAIEKTLNAGDLLSEFALLFHSHADWRAVHRGNAFEDELRHLCYVRSLPHGLMNRLSVMKEQLPQVFERALFAGWFAALLMRTQDTSPDTIYQAFVAGLFHDIGLVHIEAGIAGKRNEFSGEEWRQWQRHPYVSARRVDAVGLYDASVIRAIREHHERCDGTGYPLGLDASHLSPLGQALGVADTLFDLSIVQKADSFRRLHAARAYLNLNPETHFHSHYVAALKLIGRAEGLADDDTDTVLNAPDLNDIRARINRSRQHYLGLDDLLDDLAGLAGNKRASVITSMVERRLTLLRSSGLFSDELASWLEDLPETCDDQQLHRELLELSDMLYELEWQSRRCARQLQKLLDDELVADHPARPLLEQRLADFTRQL